MEVFFWRKIAGLALRIDACDARHGHQLPAIQCFFFGREDVRAVGNQSFMLKEGVSQTFYWCFLSIGL